MNTYRKMSLRNERVGGQVEGMRELMAVLTCAP